jgi:uncharacterized protein
VPGTCENEAVQLSRETSDANVIRAVDDGRIVIGARAYHSHLIVSAERIVENWAVTDAAALELDDFVAALEMQPEIVLLGTGAEMLLPDVALMASFAERSIGLEIMTTPAACRTYNVLVHEHRRVVAALVNAA